MTAELTAGDEPGSGFDRLLRNWLPLTYALNSLNRGMGLPDLYPFVLSGNAITKLKFIHDLVQSIQANPFPAQPVRAAG